MTTPGYPGATNIPNATPGMFKTAKPLPNYRPGTRPTAQQLAAIANGAGANPYTSDNGSNIGRTAAPKPPARTASHPAAGSTLKAAARDLAKRRAANSHPTGPDPNDPYSGIISSLPQPQTSGQMGQEAQSEISPIVQAIIAAIAQQTKGATSAISGYSNDAAAKLAAINYGQPYTQGEGAQAAVDATLSSALAGGGQADANSLQQRLAVINDPSVAAAAANVQGNGAANGNAALSQGSASLSNLIANAAAAKDYGQKQPGIQRAQGLQDIAGVEQTGQANIASGTTAAEQQLPSILSSLRSENDNRSSAIASARENQLARNDAIAAGGQKEADFQATLNEKGQATNATNQTRVDVANANNSGRVQVANIGATSRENVAATGAASRESIAAAKAAKATGAKGQLTSNEVASLVQKWHDGKPTSVSVLQPHTDANGNNVYRTTKTTTGQVGYQQAYKYLRQHGQTDQQARTALNTVYGRGDQGRSWLTNDEQAVLGKYGRQTTVGMYQGHAYISQRQMETLQAAGKLPPGELVSGRYFIKPGS